jgi:DNA-binding NarL/FixJ family response regulator
MSVIAVIATAGPGARDPEGGLPNKLIAHELGVTETTVKVHVSLVLLKFNVYSRARVIAQMSGTADLEG